MGNREQQDVDKAKTYLGDGAYVQFGSYTAEVVLTTEDGIRATNTVVPGPNEIRMLMEWLKGHTYTDGDGTMRTLDGERSIFDDVDL